MPVRYGATSAEWVHWSLVLGLTSELQPAVCQPGLPIASYSKLSSYGKVPSLVTRKGTVHGIAGWSQKHALDSDIETWMKDDRLGICLQTRIVRAFDVDVTDPVEANKIRACLAAFFPGDTLYYRFRADSSKFLVLFECAGEFGKRVMTVKGGKIEWLATGEQCLVAGLHKDGYLYEWAPSLPIALPTVSHEAITTFWEGTLAHTFATEPLAPASRLRKHADRSQTDLTLSHDPIVEFLRSIDWIKDSTADGRCYGVCPWADQHTSGSDVTSTAFFPAGTGGYETGSFCCLHAHCEARTTMEFLNAIGYTVDGFEALAPQDTLSDIIQYEDDSDNLVGTDPSLPGQSILDLPKFDRHMKTGRIKPTLHNTVLALRSPGYLPLALMHDNYRDLLMIQADQEFRPFTDSDYTSIALMLFQKGFGPGDIPFQDVRHAVNYVARKCSFDSAINWLNGLPPWDQVPRIESFCSRYLGALETPYARAVSLYWWTAHAGRILSPGCQADMAIVLISRQGTGKTSSIRAIAPDPDQYVEIDLMARDEDLSRTMRGKLIGEIAELRGIGTRDMEAVKAWISRRQEEWVPKYLEFSRTFARRLVLVGTSNYDDFLADYTGNRRWLPLHVGERQDREAIEADRHQLWAEARERYQCDGILWKEAERLAIDEHPHFMMDDMWSEIIENWLHTPQLDGTLPGSRGYLQIADVMRDALYIDTGRVKNYEGQRIGKILHALGYRRHAMKIKGRKQNVWILQAGS